MQQKLLELQNAVKEVYKAVIERDYEEARQPAQRAGAVLEELEGEFEGGQEEARLEALSALGDGLQANYHESQSTRGIRSFGLVVSNSRRILQQQLTDEEYTFDEVLEEESD